MLTQKENDLLTRTGPGTLAGRYLRMFWQPVYRAEDLAPGQAVPIRIMSQDLTLYRGEGGEAHIVDFRCAHRGTQLSVGWVEGDCIRCLYHGWKYDASGQCVEQPGEDEGFATKIKIRSYPTLEYLGLIFAYLGEGKAPPFRRFPEFEAEGVLDVATPELWPCNYFNRLENESTHVPFTHREALRRAYGEDGFRIRKVAVEETEYGIKTTTLIPGAATAYGHDLMPNSKRFGIEAAIPGSVSDSASLSAERIVWRVPVDDEQCVTYGVNFIALSGEDARAYEDRRRASRQSQGSYLESLAEEVLAGRLRLRDLDLDVAIPSVFRIEDYCTQIGQGVVPDRSAEHLGRADVEPMLLRKILFRELTALAQSHPLKQWRIPERFVTRGAATSGEPARAAI